MKIRRKTKGNLAGRIIPTPAAEPHGRGEIYENTKKTKENQNKNQEKTNKHGDIQDLLR